MSTKFTFNPFTSNFDAVSLVSIGAPANGLSITSAQVLSLQLADATHTGALSSTDWSTFNGKANANLSNLTNPTAINQDLLPSPTLGFNLGAVGSVWNQLFVSAIKKVNGNTVIDVNNSQLITNAGTEVSLDWSARTVKNSAGTALIDWSGSDPSLNTHKLTNVVDPVSPQDAATKNYVDGNFANTSLSNLANPTAINRTLTPGTTNTFNLGTSAAYWQQTFTGRVSQTTAQPYIQLGAAGTAALTDSAASKSVDWENRLLLSGATTKLDWSGTNLSVNTRKITNVVDPSSAQDVATKAYVDSLLTPIFTRQYFTTAGAATYTTPAGCTSIKIRVLGAGGGGSGSGSGAGAGNGGNDTTFGVTIAIAGGGQGGVRAASLGGAGGIATSTLTDAFGFNGQAGGAGQAANINTIGESGGAGGNSVFSGGGVTGFNGPSTNASTNSGSGGAGGPLYVVADYAGSGGGGGAYIEGYINSPAPSYAVVVGGKGTGGAAGTSGNPGSDGADGIIIIDEYYNSAGVNTLAGINRSISSISSPTTAGAASRTDYVYFVSGTTTLTLPTAVGNTNMYTIKNTGAGTVTVATTSAQTIDGSATASLAIANTSVNVVSDNANWRIV